MAHRIKWSTQAAEDLKEIVQYISYQNQDAAHSLAEKIILRIEAAANHPFSNRSVPEKNDETIREIILSPYRLIYSVEEGQQVMHIVRIWHAARGIPKI